MNFPQYRVSHGTYLPSGSNFYLLEALNSGQPGDQWGTPLNFPSLITQNNLRAASNRAAFQNAYIVGVANGFWASDTLARAAAQADYVTLTASRDAAAISPTLAQFDNNPYISPAVDNPVSGPG
jgi:hypothetical protein